MDDTEKRNEEIRLKRIENMAKARAAKETGKEDPPKRVSTTPWKPARVLDLPENMKDPNFRYRWVTTSRDGNVRKKISEGWEFDRDLQNELDKRLGIPKTLDDSKSSLDSSLQVREMVLMRMPEEMARGRDKYYADMALDPPTQGKKDMQDNVNRETSGQGGSQVFGSIKEEVY